MSRKFSRLLEIAQALRLKGHEIRAFHVTFMLHGAKIVSIGTNTLKTNPINTKLPYASKDNKRQKDKVGCHSEMVAWLKYGRENCNHISFYNVRLDVSGTPKMAAPCIGCQKLLKQIGFKSVFYTNKLGEFEEWIST